MRHRIPIMTFLLAAAFSLFSGGAKAQGEQIQVKGNVLDADSKPIPGVTIMVKGKPQLGGTITDEQGYFAFSCPAGETLQVFLCSETI